MVATASREHGMNREIAWIVPRVGGEQTRLRPQWLRFQRRDVALCVARMARRDRFTTQFPNLIAQLRAAWGGYGSALWVSAVMAGLGAVAIALLPGERVKEESAEPAVGAVVPEPRGVIDGQANVSPK